MQTWETGGPGQAKWAADSLGYDVLYQLVVGGPQERRFYPGALPKANITRSASHSITPKNLSKFEH